MAEIPFTRVVSVTSADPRHPAENLLRPEDGGKWRGAAAGEKQLSVVLELADPRPIHSLHVGNDGAAFVEVLLGSSAGGDFQVLLPSAALMSPSESRAGAGPGRVRLFGPEALVKRPATPAARWDRLQVVLSQPYCQSRPYGLSFIRVFAAPEEGEEPPPAPRRRLGPFTLREEGEGSPRRPPAGPVLPPPLPHPSRPPGPARAQLRHGRAAGERRAAPPPPPTAPPRKNPKKPPRKPTRPRPSPAPQPPRNSGTPPKNPGPPPKNRGPPQSPVLGGVVLALSGFQNPLRAHLRAAAAALGAEYRPDWTPECTHLVCAFARTPKAARARQQGGGRGGTWMDLGVSEGGEEAELRAVPLGWPRLLQQRGGGRLPRPLSQVTATANQKMGVAPPEVCGLTPRVGVAPPGVGVAPAVPSPQLRPYGGSTEANSEDEEGEGEPIPPLPGFFEDKKFFLHGDFPEGEGRQLRRFVVAFGGSLAPSWTTRWGGVAFTRPTPFINPKLRPRQALKLRPSLVFVRPHWLLLCGERQRPLPTQPFLVTSAMTSSA
ncbi:DNA repair protein XRCC1 [Anomalospiza imberbis]|uniref:DNA repair protein XRCC1 n=1 Tax=Anomalospiza imberbis TaxID=187417 RepID=UPI00358EC211